MCDTSYSTYIVSINTKPLATSQINRILVKFAMKDRFVLPTVHMIHLSESGRLKQVLDNLYISIFSVVSWLAS